MFMWHPDKESIGDARKFWRGWRGKYVPSAGEVAQLITQYAISPCMWGGGIRKRDNFRYAEWFGLDFDENVTLAKAQEMFEPYLHVIGTTKSHQKEKNGKVCDRFRVFLKFAHRCVGRDDYEETARYIIKEYGADKACKDAARLFWPCKDIVVCKSGGKVIHAKKYDPVKKERKKQWLARRDEQIRSSYSASKGIPPWARMQLDHGPDPGESRTVCCYRVARDLLKAGYTESEAIDVIWASNIPLNSSDGCYKDVRKAVRNAFGKPI